MPALIRGRRHDGAQEVHVDVLGDPVDGLTKVVGDQVGDALQKWRGGGGLREAFPASSCRQPFSFT